MAIATVYLAGCASGTTPLVEILSAAVSEKMEAGDDSKRLGTPNPKLDYLRVQAQDTPPAFLVLGYVDTHPQGDIEVWYSGQHEVIKTQNGRIVGTAGLEVDWRAVQFPSAPPAWNTSHSQGVTYQRLRDEMPSHRYTITEQMDHRAWQGTPPITLPASLTAEQARTYAWFRESTLKTTAEALPPAWFAWGLRRGVPTVVYSEQCLSASFCLKLQRWPVQEGAL